MATLYRVAEGEVVAVTTPGAACESGRYDETNWGTDWILIRAYDEMGAKRIARKYDAGLTAGALVRPRYLRPIGRFYVGETR